MDFGVFSVMVIAVGFKYGHFEVWSIGHCSRLYLAVVVLSGVFSCLCFYFGISYPCIWLLLYCLGLSLACVYLPSSYFEFSSFFP